MHATDIIGYVYNADVYCTGCIDEVAPGYEERAREADDFPKVIFASDEDSHSSRCGGCGERLVEGSWPREAVEEAGRAAGRAAGSWVVDGNTGVEEAGRILQGYDDGDPEIMDMQPSPLSGEWAGGPTPQTLADEYGLSGDELEDACDAYEDAYTDAFWKEVTRSAAAIL